MTRTSYTLHTLAKGLKVLETIEAAENGLSLTEIAHRLRESPTVAFRLLKTLAEHGYVQQDAATSPARHRRWWSCAIPTSCTSTSSRGWSL